MKNGLIVMGIATMLALSLVTFFTFFSAYTSPVKAVRVYVNNYNEANIEMILLSVLLPLNIFSAFVVTKKLAEPEKKIEKKMENPTGINNY
ncbi:MAG: hypothetical protein NT120_04625 [Candidatus Aenigmarchaeota archaeon]|nr:hypothetical protein [Candidatus Aenigmarchaeota archaeon]